MENSQNSGDKNEDLQDALKDVNENKHQDLSQENIGNEPEEQTSGDPESPYKLKGLEDKRPESDNIEKGWTVDSDTSTNADDPE
ncbi:MAG: hypothetical protein ABWY16_09190 [Pedobacter sp.]|uniref:hypothetical protein n=1 Tax=Pedobacter sp. TaxID=1411316 RepID=UPI00339810EC